MNDKDKIISELMRTIEQQRDIIEKLVEENSLLRRELEVLREEMARFKKNSSKPPSSDIVKPPKKKTAGKKRKRGGQKGQARRECKLTLDQAQEIVPYSPEGKPCEKCGGHMEKSDELLPRTTFQYELPEQPAILTAHVAHGEKCSNCNAIHYAKVPDEITRGGLLGPRLTAFLATIRAEGNASISGCQKIIKGLNVEISRGAICNGLDRMGRALEDTYEKLLARLPGETRLNIDETTLPQDGKKLWIWTFVAQDFTLFKVDPSRSSSVLESVLGSDCRAIVGSDLFGAYTFKPQKTKRLRLSRKRRQRLLPHSTRPRTLNSPPTPERLRILVPEKKFQ